MSLTLVQAYLDHRGCSLDELEPGFLAYLANLECVARSAPQIAASIVQELHDQRTNIKLIASENYSSLATQCAMANLLTDKYAEGVPPTADQPVRRFYAGCDNVDTIEADACARALELFGAEHAYVQPHSGADANLVAFWAILSTLVQTPMLDELGVRHPAALSHEDWERIRQSLGNQRLLAMDFASGGHLTHGYRLNVSAKMFDAFSYGVDRVTKLLDYDQIERQAQEVRPLILLAGYSAYPRRVDFRRMREIADAVGAVLMVDMAHFAGLVAGGVFQDQYNPVTYADVLTSTTHKTLRGPRGGLVLCTRRFAEQVDKGCPLVLGGPLPHVMAAKAVCFSEALQPAFGAYSRQVVENAASLAEACIDEGLSVVSGGTENHLVLLDVSPLRITGYQAEAALRECRITLNRNAIPFDPQAPQITSGLRLGTAAVTTLGMGPEEMRTIASVIKLILSNISARPLASGPNAGKPSKKLYDLDATARQKARARVEKLLPRFPVYPEFDLAFLQSRFGSPAPSATTAATL